MISNKPRHWISTCSEDENGNIILDFPDELLETVGWKEGDVLEIVPMSNSIRITRIENSDSTDGGLLESV